VAVAGSSIVARMPGFVGWVTLGAGTALVAAPGRVSGPLGLAGQDVALRAIGLSDLVFVPGLLRGNPRWPWMAGRAVLNPRAGRLPAQRGAAVLLA
jgi:hypothetical protein